MLDTKEDYVIDMKIISSRGIISDNSLYTKFAFCSILGIYRKFVLSPAWALYTNLIVISRAHFSITISSTAIPKCLAVSVT
jgi:hypothetical protein